MRASQSLIRYPLGLLLGFLLACQGRAETEAWPRVEVVADLLEVFRPAMASNTSECAPRRPASAGRAKQDGLFQHPKSAGPPARVDYFIDLPGVSESDVLLLAFDIGLADGIQFGRGEDGVRFMIEMDGQERFSREWRECRWESHALNLTPHAGRRIRLALLVDALSNTTYDWATWGNPRILRFRNARLASRDPDVRNRAVSPIMEGALAFRGAAGLKVTVRSVGATNALEWTLPPARSAAEPPSWIAKDFTFPAGQGLAIEWEPRDTPPEIWLAEYAAQLRLVQTAATRAVIVASDSAPLRVVVKNEGRGKLREGEARVNLKIGQEWLPLKTLPAMAPGETWHAEWDWTAPAKEGIFNLTAQLQTSETTEEKKSKVEVFGQPGATESIQNEHLKLEFVRAQDGFAYAKMWARQGDDWAQVAVWRPLFQIVSGAEREQDWEIRPSEVRRTSENAAAILELAGTGKDAAQVEWRAKVRVRLEPGQPLAHVRYEWDVSAPRPIRATWGPNLYVGDGTTGEAKSWGLFPGLEYLHGPERSSNPRDFAPPLDDRRTPHPHKITVPLMAVTVGPRSQYPPEKAGRFFAPDSLKDQPPAANFESQISNLKSEITVALLWHPFQRWDGEHAFPSARFASPNLDDGMRNHRLGLFLPSSPDFVRENADRATEPYLLMPGKSLTLDAAIVVAPGPAAVALREWLRLSGGLSKPNPWPRSFQEELEVCRAGFLRTVWDEKSEKWRHCIGWASSHAPGFAALLWLDSQLAKEDAARRQSRDRVELAVKNMLRDSGPGLFTSQANCHIMQWEFPFLHGYLPEAMGGLESQIQHLMQTQRPDGGWVYQPANEQQADLGQAGDSVLGTCANRAATLLRYARITGDATALAAGEKALRFMERFRVPRGGQTWECPMYEPDILAAAYAVRAYHDAFRVTGNPRWLHDAVYWAETGVPFVYLWTLPDRPMMLGATIPVFGSTFYTHTWLGVPVQWCGLVYAYHVFHLAQELERTTLRKTDSPLPLALNFASADWRRLVELITVSATHQQFADGERIGAYPDSISNFEKRHPAFINPEDILVNVLALEGHDPDIQTVRIKSPHGQVVVSSAARIENAQIAGGGVAFDLRFFAGESSHTLLAGVKARDVRVNGARLAESASPVRREAAWWWDERRRRLYLTIQHKESSVRVELDSP